MPHKISYVDNSGGTLAHYRMLEVIRDFAAANGWQVLRYDTVSDDRQLILKGPGYTGSEEIFVGFRTYQNAAADYYNLLAGVFTGFVPANSFDTQPGVMLSGVPAHNQRIDYWLTLNPQRIALGMKVGTPVYQHAYVGKMLPYARPSQYPYPVVCGGALTGAQAVRFSETTHSSYYRGNRPNLRLRANDGWIQPHTFPWSSVFITGDGANYSSRNMRDTNGIYLLLPIELHDNTANLWGALDGVFYISGFDNVVENTLSIGADQYVVLQDVWRTAHNAYYAMRMDA